MYFEERLREIEGKNVHVPRGAMFVQGVLKRDGEKYRVSVHGEDGYALVVFSPYNVRDIVEVAPGYYNVFLK